MTSERYALTAQADEAALYRESGASAGGIAYMADSSPEALRQSGGAMALFAWYPSSP